MADLSAVAIGSADELRDAYSEHARVTCMACATEPLTPDVSLAVWPRPWLDPEPEEVLCTECWPVK